MLESKVFYYTDEEIKTAKMCVHPSNSNNKKNVCDVSEGTWWPPGPEQTS